MSMRENMARAAYEKARERQIAEIERFTEPHDCVADPPWAEASEDRRAPYLERADIHLDALATPTDEMIDFAVEQQYGHLPEGPIRSTALMMAGIDYKLMIRAARAGK